MGISGFSLFDYYGQCCYEHLSTSFCKKLGFISLAVGKLDQTVSPSITFQGLPPSSKTPALFYMPTSILPGFQFLCILTNTCLKPSLLATEHSLQDLSPPGAEPVPLSWEHGLLTRGPPRSSLSQCSRSVVSDSLQPHEPQHAKPPCPSPTPGVHPNPCPLSR